MFTQNNVSGTSHPETEPFDRSLVGPRATRNIQVKRKLAKTLNYEDHMHLLLTISFIYIGSYNLLNTLICH
jgi:hypothetical protein